MNSRICLFTSANNLFRTCVLLLFCCGSSIVMAEQVENKLNSQPSSLNLKAERVFVFKDGYFLVVKTGEATTDSNGELYCDDVPEAAVLGSFWATADVGTIRSMKAGWVDESSEETESVVCKTTIEVIKANEGKPCSFVLGEGKHLSGVIGKVLLRKTEVEQPMNSALLRTSVQTGSRPTDDRTFITGISGEQFVLKTDEGDILIHANEVNQLTIRDMNTTIDQLISKTTKKKRLTLKFDEVDSKVHVTMLYFRPGFRWVPTYRVDLAQSDEEKQTTPGKGEAKKWATLKMQGELINEAEDFADMPIDVVVGVPNFRFKATPSPMVLENVMLNALSSASPPLANLQNGNNQFSNAIYSQVDSTFQSDRAAGGQGADVDFSEGMSGQGGNDLFVYHLPSMTLKKGERATVPILETKVAYRDVYTWDIFVTHSESFVDLNETTISPLELSENKVWRQVELINDTKVPWTTGAAMFMDGFQPLAQELLTYTSPGSICRVPITVSVDMRGRVVDQETGRKPDQMEWQGYKYGKVNANIEVELANNKLEPVSVEINLTFGGKATRMSDDGKLLLSPFVQEDWRHYSAHSVVNNRSSINWKTTIEPGQCFKPNVDYHFYFRR